MVTIDRRATTARFALWFGVASLPLWGVGAGSALVLWVRSELAHRRASSRDSATSGGPSAGDGVEMARIGAFFSILSLVAVAEGWASVARHCGSGMEWIALVLLSTQPGLLAWVAMWRRGPVWASTVLVGFAAVGWALVVGFLGWAVLFASGMC